MPAQLGVSCVLRSALQHQLKHNSNVLHVHVLVWVSQLAALCVCFQEGI